MLEVELPFLQAVLGDFALVPLLVGGATGGEVRKVLERLWDGPDTLLVISSDLSHYEPYGRAKEHDAATAAAIERLDATRLGPARMPAASCRSAGCSWRPVDAACAWHAWICATQATPRDPRTGWSATAPGRFTRLEGGPPCPFACSPAPAASATSRGRGRSIRRGLPDAEMLGYYAARLRAVEIINTFYRLPKAKLLEDWGARPRTASASYSRPHAGSRTCSA